MGASVHESRPAPEAAYGESVAPPSRRKPRPEPSAVPILKTEADGCILWEVTLKKEDPSEKYGFSYANRRDVAHEAEANEALPGVEVLIVKGLIADGLMFDWNIEYPDAQVRPGDRITDVNGKRSVLEMKEALHSDTITLK